MTARPGADADNPGNPAWLRSRVARPSRDLERALRFYVDVLWPTDQGGLRGHEGYDGLFLTLPGPPPPTTCSCSTYRVAPRSAWLPPGSTSEERPGWRQRTPYWERHGIPVVDPGGRRVVVAVAD